MVSRHSCAFLRTCSIQEPDTPKPSRSASFVCLSVCQSIRPSLHLLVCPLVSACVLDVCLSLRLSIHASACLSIGLCIRLSVCASVCWSVCQPPYLRVSLSVCLRHVRHPRLRPSRPYHSASQHEYMQLAQPAFLYVHTDTYSLGSKLTVYAWMFCKTVLMKHTKIAY